MMIQLNADMESALKSIAEQNRRSPEDIVHALIAQEFDVWQEPINPAVLEELDRRHAKFMETGSAVPWEKVRLWMESWFTDEELPPPEPERCLDV